MSMGRNIITMNESGNIIMTENVTDIWMSEPELVELFGVIVPTLRAAIKAVYWDIRISSQPKSTQR